MKTINTALIIGAIAVLFFVWNFRIIFGKNKKIKANNTSKSMRATKSRQSGDGAIASKAMGEAIAKEEEQTAQILKEVLSLNRAAHVLTRSGSVLDKLLKMDKVKACESLVREYELSSVMVLVKHEEHEEGFKKIDAIEEKKMDDSSSSSAASAADTDKTVKVNTEPHPHPSHKPDHHHHTTSDPMRIALFCRNVGRVPRIGRVVRMVESEDDHDDKYIIELIK